MSHIKRKRLAEINVVPYIDVMLVLLIIFMVTAPMLTQGVKVKLPQASSQAVASSDNMPLIITVDKDGRYFLSSEHEGQVPLGLSMLALRVKALTAIAKSEGQDKQILVKGDRDVTYEKVVYLMASLKTAGISHVGLLTKEPPRQLS